MTGYASEFAKNCRFVFGKQFILIANRSSPIHRHFS
jgi:hypothetical protein